MEKIYMLDNSQGVIRTLVGLKSRISPMNHRLWTVIAPMLFVAFGLFGVNEKAWATWPSYEGSCSNSGYVLVEDDETYSAALPYNKEYDLAGPGATLTFKACKTILSVDNNIKVYQYVDGAYQKDAIYTKNDPGKAVKNKWGITTGYTYEDNAFSCTLSPKATKIKFVFAGSLNKYIKEVRVTRYSDNAYALYNDNLDCGSADYNLANSDANHTSGTAYVDWSHKLTAPNCTITGTNAEYFYVKSTSNTPSNNNYGAMSVEVAYKHTAPGDHFATLNVGGKTITVKGHTNKITPYIVTTPTVDTITYGQTISNSQLGTGLVKADLINAAGTVVSGTWTIDENGQTVTASGGANTTINLTFTPADQNTYNVIHTTQTMYVRSASTITWASAYSATKPTIPIGKTIENAATTNAAGATVTYSTSDSDVIVIENEGTTFRAIAEGEATITASHGVTPTHGAASEEKTFKTTFKDIQVIVWNDRFDRLTTEMTSKNLLAQVWIENPVSGERTYSAARTALLEYSVEDNTVVSIPENSTTLTIHKKGNTTLTASVEGNEQYESASVTMVVKVREPSAGCDDPLLLDEKNNGTNDYLYRLFDNSTSKPELHTDEYAINVAQGQVPDKLSFAHKGEEYKVVGLSFWTYYSGTIKAQQKVNGNWIDVPNSSVTPEKSKWNTIEGLQLDEKATHIRFVRPQGGEGYHYVRNVEVTMKHFIRTATPTVDFGNTIKVNSSEYQDVVVKYSNVKDALQVVNPFTSDVTVSDEVIDVDSCGAFGSATLRISFSPTTATEIDDYIVVKDPIVGNSSALSIRVKADVQRADQTITWNPATSISTIDQILLNGTTNGQEYGQMNVIGYEVTNNDGVISVTNNVVTILKPGAVTITASQPGTTNYDVAEPVEKNFTISAEPLTLVAPTTSDITYGQALPTLIGGSAKDSKGNDVDGTFAWQNPDAVLNAGNNQTPTVVFTPSENAAWYTGLTTTTTINVAKADPVATVENVSFAYGTKAEDVSLVGTGAGTWNWTDTRKDDVLAAGSYTMDVHFVPTDATNYNEKDVTVSLTVNKADPVVAANAVEINYGATASSVDLEGTGVAGTWSWTDTRKDDVLAAGSYTMDVHFVPTDATNYNEKDVTVSLTVNKADPVVAANAVEINYGATASSVDLEGTGVAGTWSWADTRKDQVLAAGSYTLNVHFIPNDATNYNEKDATVALTVKKADPVVAANAVEITYGATASSVALSGTGVAGTWSWTDSRAAQTLAAGVYNDMAVKFTPTDGVNYNELSTTITLTVSKADPEVTVSNVGITYGATASSVALSGTGDGEWSWDDSRATQTLAAGVYDDMAVKFTPTDGDNYNELSTTITLTVSKADPEVTVSNVGITYGATASSVALSGTGDGEWSWDDSRATQTLAAGVYNDMAVKFTPTDGDNYNELSTTITLTVSKADPVATASAVEITYGTLASSVALSGTGVAGTWSWTDTRKDDVLAAGSYTMNVHFIPNDATNYNEKDATVVLTVKKATTTLSWTSNPTDLAYNATDAVYTATSASDGAITYSIISGGSYAHIDANTGALTIDLPGNTITIQAEQAEGTNYRAPTTITVEVAIAAAPVGPNSFTNNTGDNDWQNAENWTNGVPSGVNPDVIISGALIIDESVTVGGLTILPTGGVTVVESGTLTVNGESADQSAYGDLHVTDDGNVVLGNSADLQVRNFKLDASLGNSSNAGTSGQVSGDSKLHVNGDAYFQMSFDVSGQITYGWYDFVVPFEVDALNGVLDANGVQIVYGTDYIIMNHSEEKRARNQKAWNTFTGTLEPGRIYTITFEETKTWNTFLFKKKAGSDLVNSATYTSDYSSTIGETQDRGWNGFGNGTLQHRELTNLTGISKVQMYNHTENRYDAIDNWNEKALAVGTAFSIQVAGSQSIVLETADVNKPLRAQASMRTIDEFRLTLTAEGADYSSDRMWVSASDEATGDYVIGHDLLKMGTPTQAKVAQMWAINNNLLLCDIEMPMANDMAQCMLGLFAPNAGQYILAIDAAPEDANLYLTYNGNIIWDLTASPYVLDLTKGTTTGYGLRIEAANAPQITTGVEDVQGDGAQVRKVIIDNKMYIITPEGAIFDAIGKKVQ